MPARRWPGVLAVVLALASGEAAAQSRNAERALEDLIPDSALDDPESWARQLPAAEQAQAPVAADDLDPSSPLAPLPEMELAWPEDQPAPVVEPLAPEPDLAVAEQEIAAELEAVGAASFDEAPRFENGVVRRVSDSVELAVPPDAEFPERAAIEERFVTLSTLNRLDDDEAEDNLAQVARRARNDRDLLVQILRVYGYHDGEVFQSLGGAGAGGAATPAADQVPVVRFDVIPGPRYTFGTIDLGDLAATGSDEPRLRQAFAIQPGAPANADSIVAGRTALAAALAESGYAFATIGEADLLIDHERREGDLSVPVSPGGRYVFGPVTSSKPGILSSRHLSRIARFDPGDSYRLSLVEDLRRAVLATGLVSSVTVTPRQAQAPSGDDPGTVAVDVALTEGPLRTVAGLAGYSSGEGLRVEASWEHRNLFPPEGMLRVRGVVGTREQLAGVTFRRNNVTGRDKVLTFDLYGQTVDRDAFQGRTVAFLATFERQSTIIYQKDFVWSAGFEAVATGEREGTLSGALGPRQTYFIAALPVRAGIDQSNDLLDPTRGFRASLRLSPELSVQGGMRSTYLKAQADVSAYQPVSDRVVLAGRARLGTIGGADIAEIAPSRRFYAGGGGSVRGYGYQRIGPRDSLGDPTGGRSLSELSVEARIRTGFLGGALSVVPFVDAGAVDETATPTLRDLRFGAGVGVRYHSNFGPIRIDLGTPLNRREGDSRIAVYVSLGQAF